MKKLPGLAAAALVCGSLVSGCGGGSSTNIAAIEQAMANCSKASMASMLRAFYAVIGVPDFIAGESPVPGYIVDAVLSTDPLDPPNTWDFSVVFDSNSNAIFDSAVVGKITFSEDPTDGLDPGAILTITFTVQNTPVVAGVAVENGTVTGSGNLVATLGLSTDEADITGTISLTDTAGAGCAVELTFPVGTPLHLDFSGGAPALLAANVVLFEFYGTIQMILETLGHTLDATVTIVNGDQTIDVAGDIDGISSDFDFELLPSDAEIQQLLTCSAYVELLTTLVDLYNGVLDSLGGGATPPGVVITPTANPSVFTYTADLVMLDPGIFATGMLSGQATLTFPMIAGAPLPSEVSFTWTFSNTTLTNAVALSGSSTRPLHLQLDGVGDLVALSGAGTFGLTESPPLAGILAPLDCTVTFDIPETDPLVNGFGGGILIVTVTDGTNILRITQDADGNLGLSINGIPVPFSGF